MFTEHCSTAHTHHRKKTLTGTWSWIC